MRDQLKRLEELQRHDAKIQELQSSVQAIPAKIQATENDLARVEAMLAQERAQLGETQRYYGEQKGMVDADTNHVTDARAKMNAVKNPRELAAAQREIEHTRDSLQVRETEIAKLVEAMNAKEKVLAERASEVEKLRESIQKDGEVARAKSAELEAEIAALRGERDKVAAGLRPDVLKRYSTIRIRRGLAIAAVRSGTCTACNMNIPPQLFNVLRRGTSIESCPYCHRIIYWEDLMKDPTPDESPAAPASAE